jgi:uncharacterized damage-inducible protein DinB
MNTDDIKLMYEYNYWADRRILATCAKVSPEQFVTSGGDAFGGASLRALLVHILDSEWAWRNASRTTPWRWMRQPETRSSGISRS